MELAYEVGVIIKNVGIGIGMLLAGGAVYRLVDFATTMGGMR